MVTGLLKMCTLGKQNMIKSLRNGWFGLFFNIILSLSVFQSNWFQTLGQPKGRVRSCSSLAVLTQCPPRL